MQSHQITRHYTESYSDQIIHNVLRRVYHHIQSNVDHITYIAPFYCYITSLYHYIILHYITRHYILIGLFVMCGGVPYRIGLFVIILIADYIA